MLSTGSLQGRSKSGLISVLKKHIEKKDLLLVLALVFTHTLYEIEGNLSYILLLHGFIALLVGIFFTILNRDKSILSYRLFIKALIMVLFVLAGAIPMLIYVFKLPLSFIFSIIPLNLIFLLPVSTKLCAEHFLNIPKSDYKLWDYHPEKDLPDFDMIDMSTIIVVELKIKRHPSDQQLAIIKAKGLPDMRLGDFFHVFVTEYNEKMGSSPIIIFDRNKNTFMWEFFKEGIPLFSNRLDPDLSLAENNVLENQTIIAKRARKSSSEEVTTP